MHLTLALLLKLTYHRTTQSHPNTGLTQLQQSK